MQANTTKCKSKRPSKLSLKHHRSHHRMPARKVSRRRSAKMALFWCADRATDVLHGALTCFSTRRAPSSPHLACGLNGSLFLHFCSSLAMAQAGRLVGVLGVSEPCGTLHQVGISSKGLEALPWRYEGGYFKKSNFSNQRWGVGWRPRIPWGLELQKGVTNR